MMIFLYIYIAGAGLVALRLFRHILFRLDRYDWYYSKGNIFGVFLFSVVLWPLFLIKPQHLIDPTELFKDTFNIAGRRRERVHLWENPPPCGSVIRYRQEYDEYRETYGEFLFRTVDVEQALCTRIQEYPHLANDDEGAILNWINRRSERLAEPTDVPSAWSRFEFVANSLVRAGSAKVRCLKCGMELGMGQLMINDDHRLVCPNGHNLLVVQKAHFLMGSS